MTSVFGRVESEPKKTALPSKPFYLIFRAFEVEKITPLSRDVASAKAQELAKDEPFSQFVLMKAETIFTCECTSVTCIELVET